MNLLLVARALVAACGRQSQIVLPRKDRRAAHILEVLRRTAYDGHPISVGVIGGPTGTALLRDVGPETVTLACKWRGDGDDAAAKLAGPPPRGLLPVDVMVGLARPTTCRKVLRDLSTVGVRSITFVQCQLTQKSYATSKLWTTDEWSQQLLQGAEQAYRTSLPTVHHCSSIGQALQGVANGPVL
jgi:16S rRNA (uracil1498-N3)-methyltransferase